VSSLLRTLSDQWSGRECRVQVLGDPEKKESTLLKLCCDKALGILNWRPVLDFSETVAMTAHWYRVFYEKGGEAAARLTGEQIEQYVQRAIEREAVWTK
jgi:CDP-glucose 4,6-dehydratase